MGRNAQARRGWTDVKPQASATPQARQTRTQARLRQRMQEIRTLAQFEYILQDAHEDHRGTMRRLLAPMLRPDLPCCGAGALEARTGQPQEHAPVCPTKRLVVLQ